MTVTYGFYDSLGGDRTYNALQFSSLLDSIINDGVFMSIGSCFAISPGTGLQAHCAIGRAWFEHTWTYNDALIDLTITTPHAVLDRIDTVVIETNSDPAVRANTIKVMAGTPASSPVPPTLTHTSYIHQHPLADILVPANATGIIQGNITNRVGTADCPFVTGILESVDIDFLFAQWESDFDNWFQYLVDQLSGEQVTMLLNLIMTHDHSDPQHTQVVTGGIADAAITLLKLDSTLRFQKIAEFTGDGSNNFDFSSIPQTFKHLLITCNGSLVHLDGGYVSGTLAMRVNSDTASHYYTTQWLRDTQSEKWNFGITNPNNWGLHLAELPNLPHTPDATIGSALALILDYTNTSKFKNIISLGFMWGLHSGLTVAGSQWNQTAAINRLTSLSQPNSAYLTTGSVVSLYGIN